MKEWKTMGLICALVLLFLATPCVSRGAEKSAPSSTIAVLPFSMHTPSNLAYLQDGIRDMFTSRLAWQGKVQVLDRTVTDQALRGAKSEITLNDAIRIGSSLKADYVLFGSVTALGQSISIDGKLAPISGKTEPITLYGQTKTLDEVIPKINQFAQDINQKVFSRPTEQVQASPSDNELSSTRNPELLVPETMKSGDKISYLNPNFLEVTPEGALRQAGIWRSQTFKGGIVGMDIGDLDGDGRPEIVTVTDSKLSVLQREANGLKSIATFNGTKVDRFLSVSVADADKDGKDEIYLTNLRRRNIPTGNTTESSAYGRDTLWEPQSFALSLINGKLQVVAENQPYFLNAIQFPKRGKVLLGQRKADDAQGTLRSEIYELQPRGNRLAELTTMALPSRCNVFNFAKADINNDGNEEVLLIDTDNHLLVLDAGGNQMWKSRHRFAATSNSFEGKVTDLRYNQVDYFYLPSPIMITDLNKDNILEVVVNRSPDYSRFMPEGLKYYESGEVVSLSWDQMGLVENWKTRDIGGMVTAVRVADTNRDGVPELLATLVIAKDFLKLWQSESTIFSYDLDVAQAKTAKQP